MRFYTGSRSKTADERAHKSHSNIDLRESAAGSASDFDGIEHGNALLGEDELNFDVLMDELASARNRLRSLQDIDRRNEATALTMHLISKLGLEDDSDSDPESS